MPSVSSAFFQAFSCAFKARLPLLAAALWWGSGMGLGFVAAPLLIRHAASVPQAAAFTLEIFQAQTWLALACGVALLLTRPRAAVAHGRRAFVCRPVPVRGCAAVASGAAAKRLMRSLLLFFWEQIQGPENGSIARFDGLGCY